MNIAITGANGFVGSVLVEALLARGWNVRALSRTHPSSTDEKGIQWFRGDLRHSGQSALEDFLNGVDVLIHCAAELYDESLMEAVHITGTRRLIEAASGRIRHWVQLSSCGVYGPVRKGPITELSPFRPIGVYEQTKFRAEQIVMKSAANEAFTATVLRPSIIYGDHMTNQSLCGWINAVERGLFFYIGRPGAWANYVHVDDVAEALCRCGVDARAKGKSFNLSAGCTIEEFVHAMCVALNYRKPRIRLPESLVRLMALAGQLIPGFPLKPSRVDALTVQAFYSSEFIRDEIGFEPKVDAQEGLKRLILKMKDE